VKLRTETHAMPPHPRHPSSRVGARIRTLVGIVLASAGSMPGAVSAQELATLKPAEMLDGFRVINVYENAAGRAVGARLLAVDYGFIVDYLQIQSVPQAFFWIKTLPSSDRGEPHACEHLLLGKGGRGRYAAALEDMALATSTAYTGQTKTCYHFHTTAGLETFYAVFEAKLQALVHPTFTDEEIRREVCHLDVIEDPQTGSLALEEKGSVYTEMVSTFEKPWYHVGRPLDLMLYGEAHPLARISGGNPEAMRAMTAEDLRRFHHDTHHLARMGVILSMPESVSVASCLARLQGILARCQPEGDYAEHPAMCSDEYPAPVAAPLGTMRLTTYPSRNPEDPGYLSFAWPSDLALEPSERFLLELFLEAFAGGQTSLLHDLLIRSDTRRLDIGGSGVYAGVEREGGNAIGIGLQGIDNRAIHAAMVDSVRTLIGDALRRLHDLADGSVELIAFNEKVRSRLIEDRKQLEHDLDSPPMFGDRGGPAGAWLAVLEDVEEDAGFRKPLISPRYAVADSMLSLDRNPWGDLLERCQLLSRPPYAVGVSPSPEYLDTEAQAKQERLARHLVALRERFGVDTDQAALAAYRAEFDARTRDLEDLAHMDTLPSFVSDPPLTLDDGLVYTTGTLAGNVPYVATTFESMTSATVGIALRMDVLPESLLVYAPILPDILTEIGVTLDGETLPYEQMQERVRREILGLGAGFDVSPETERVELSLSGQASRREELPHLFRWMEAALCAPNLRRENLPRLLDLIDQTILWARNATKSSEEGWVAIPAEAYRFQHNPLWLSTRCFLTQVHELQRVRWRLTDPGDAQAAALGAYLQALCAEGVAAGRDTLRARLTLLADPAVIELPASIPPRLRMACESLSPGARRIANEIAASLLVTLPDLPDANLAGDLARLCTDTEADLRRDPQAALDDIELALELLRRTGNARVVIISNSADRPLVIEGIGGTLARLAPDAAPRRVSYDRTPRILARLRTREPRADQPLYVGLLHPATRNGTLLFSARVAEPYDPSDESVLRCLAGGLFGGGGAHGFFMRTWAEGLAYSNGYGYGERSGRASYYAERCPDVAETMRFVVRLLAEAPDDPQLVEYAIAQAFDGSRAPSRYETRGRAIAADLVDGFPPERVRTFRQAVLRMRARPDLYAQLQTRLPAVYGPVLIGYGAPIAQSDDGVFFLIGPESQFRSLEQLIASAEGPQPVYRLYPRDFWLTD
jgi:Zn-dependent M16 (insulinase) family peptidase